MAAVKVTFSVLYECKEGPFRFTRPSVLPGVLPIGSHISIKGPLEIESGFDIVSYHYVPQEDRLMCVLSRIRSNTSTAEDVYKRMKSAGWSPVSELTEFLSSEDESAPQSPAST